MSQPPLEDRHEGLAREDARRLRLFLRVGLVLFVLLTGVIGVVVWFVQVDITVPAVGRLVAANQIDVESPVAGVVSEVYVAEGDRVVQGDLLVRFDDAQLRSALRTAQLDFESSRARETQLEAEIHSLEGQINSRIATAEAKIASLKIEDPEKIRVQEAYLQRSEIRVSQANADYLKAKALFDQGVISGQKYEEAKKTLELAQADEKVARHQLEAARSASTAAMTKAQAELLESQADRLSLEIKRKELALLQFEIEQAENEIERLNEDLALLELRASAAGEILTHRPDQLIGRYLEPGARLLRIGNAEDLLVDAQLDEQFLPKVRPGMPAKVYLPALPFREYRVFEGSVSKIGAAFERSDGDSVLSGDEGASSSAKTPIQILLKDSKVIHDGREIQLRPGLTAEVEIIVKSVGVFELAREEIQKIRSRKAIAR